jgi:UDP-N-acetylmuramate--alanine ligase
VLFVTDVYAASEDPIEGVTARALTEEIERFGHRHVEYAGHLAGAAAKLKAVVQPGDLVLTLGAGNVWQAGEELLRILD